MAVGAAFGYWITTVEEDQEVKLEQMKKIVFAQKRERLAAAAAADE
jgi:hypothetical protein